MDCENFLNNKDLFSTFDIDLKVLDFEDSSLATEGFLLSSFEGQLGLKDLSNTRQSPLIVNFLDPDYQRRLKQSKISKEVLPKALGWGRGNRKIFDATAGLGKDLFLLAYYGFEVTASEYHPLIYLLLQDGLHRAAKYFKDLKQTTNSHHCNNDKEFRGSIELKFGDSLNFLKSQNLKTYDAIYMDPMFGYKNSLAKKGMQILRDISQEDWGSNIQTLFREALRVSSDRVVIKRSSKDNPVTDANFLKPTFCVDGKGFALDVYQKISKIN